MVLGAISPIRPMTLRAPSAADPFTDEEPVLAALTAASLRGLIATGHAPANACAGS